MENSADSNNLFDGPSRKSVRLRYVVLSINFIDRSVTRSTAPDQCKRSHTYIKQDRSSRAENTESGRSGGSQRQ